MVVRIKEGGTGQVTAPGARIALGLSDQDIIDIVTPSIGGPFQPEDSDLTAIAALTTTAFGRAFLTLANGPAALTYIGAAPAGSYQPLDSDLTAIAALTTTSFGRSFLDRADAAAARTLLGLGTMATETATNYLTTASAASTYLTIVTAASTYLPLAGGTLSGGLIGTTASFTTGAFSGLLTTNGQIAFPASQNPSANVNTLDDYEEGTWTPTYVAGSGAYGAITYTGTGGYYTKIGSLVNITGNIATNAFAIGTAPGTAVVNIGGIPFTTATGTHYQGMVYIGSRSAFAASQNNPASGSILPNATFLSLHTVPGSTLTGGGFLTSGMVTGAVSNQNQIRFAAQYIAA